jgi:hypothetical protein
VPYNAVKSETHHARANIGQTNPKHTLIYINCGGIL